MPELPPSVGATVMVLSGLALVLSYATHVPATTRGARTADEVGLKAQRLVAELESMQATLATVKALLNEPAPQIPEHTAAEITAHVERLAEEVGRLSKLKSRIRQAAEMLAKAVRDAQPFARALERVLPGWAAALVKVQPVIEELLKEIDGLDFEAIVRSIAPELQAMLAMTMAAQGFDEWAARLPSEDGPLVDEADGVPIRWSLEHGWVT
jgi:hypothetical protein